MAGRRTHLKNAPLDDTYCPVSVVYPDARVNYYPFQTHRMHIPIGPRRKLKRAALVLITHVLSFSYAATVYHERDQQRTNLRQRPVDYASSKYAAGFL